MRVTIFGATGMLGKALMRRWSESADFEGQGSEGQRKDEIIGLGSADADIRVGEQVEQAVARTRPDWIVLAAAYTDVDGCEINPKLAEAVNTRGAANVAKAAAGAGSRLLFVSTDYVFDGKNNSPYETDHPRSPINEYGKSKAAAEEQILSILSDACIARTSCSGTSTNRANTPQVDYRGILRGAAHPLPHG